jgi:hypothetical protein
MKKTDSFNLSMGCRLARSGNIVSNYVVVVVSGVESGANYGN